MFYDQTPFLSFSLFCFRHPKAADCELSCIGVQGEPMENSPTYTSSDWTQKNKPLRDTETHWRISGSEREGWGVVVVGVGGGGGSAAGISTLETELIPSAFSLKCRTVFAKIHYNMLSTACTCQPQSSVQLNSQSAHQSDFLHVFLIFGSLKGRRQSITKCSFSQDTISSFETGCCC